MPDDDTPTPVQTPSAMLRLGLENCPLCHRTGMLTGGHQCWYCSGGRLVSREKAEAWRKAHPHVHDYDKLPDTEPEEKS